MTSSVALAQIAADHLVCLADSLKGLGIRFGVRKVERNPVLPDHLLVERPRNRRQVEAKMLGNARGALLDIAVDPLYCSALGELAICLTHEPVACRTVPDAVNHVASV